MVVKFSAFSETGKGNLGYKLENFTERRELGTNFFVEFYSPSYRSRIVIEGLLRRALRFAVFSSIPRRVQTGGELEMFKTRRGNYFS